MSALANIKKAQEEKAKKTYEVSYIVKFRIKASRSSLFSEQDLNKLYISNAILNAPPYANQQGFMLDTRLIDTEQVT